MGPAFSCLAALAVSHRPEENSTFTKGMTSSMAGEVTILAFGSAAEALGWKRRVCALPADGRLGGLTEPACAGIPAAASWRFAVNERYVGEDHTLRDGDEVAIIPPVAGG